MNPRQNFYSSVFEQIMNYKKEREFQQNRNFLFDPIVGLGLFASVLVVGVFSGYLPDFSGFINRDGSQLADMRIIKTEQRPAADIFSADTSSAAENPAEVYRDSVPVIPSEDGYVSADSPQKSFGSEAFLKVDKNPQRFAYLKFKVPANEKFTKVILRLYPQDSNENGGALSVMSDNLWSERLLTFDARPSNGEVRIGPLGSVSSRVAKFVEVTNYIQSGKTYTFKVSTDGSDGVNYSSREASSETSPALLLVK